MRRIQEIDGLRGIAILMVISFHYLNNQLVNNTTFIGHLLFKVTQFGWVGVDLFFVLSGFLIGSILLSNKNSPNYFKTFYIRRLVRIIPNYYLLIVVYSIVLAIPQFKNNQFLTGDDILPFWSYVFLWQNFFMAKFQTLGNHSMGVTWSIAIEEQFYILFPFILYKINIRKVPYLLVSLILLAIVLRFFLNDGWIPKYVLLITRVDSLSIGMLISWLYLNVSMEDVMRKYKFHLLGSLILLILSCGILYLLFNDLGNFKHTLFACIFGLILILAISNNQNLLGVFLRNKILTWIGTISYSLYLFHDYVLGLTFELICNRQPVIYNLQDYMLTFLAFIISLLIGYSIYLFLETPMIAIGKKYKY